MRLESVGKITSIKYKSKAIELTFDNFENIKISEETFTNHYLFINKEITKSDYDNIVEEEKNVKLLKYTLNILSSKMYTEKEIILKLKQKKANKKEIDNIIKYLKINNLIDDKKYSLEYKENLETKNMGKNAIIFALKNKGISQKNLDLLVFDDNEEIKKANYHIDLLNRKYKDKSNKSKTQLIYQSLLRLGFDTDIINDIIKKVEISSFEEEENNLQKELLKIKYQNLDNNQKIKKLLAKGYNYEIIKKVLKGE